MYSMYSTTVTSSRLRGAISHCHPLRQGHKKITPLFKAFDQNLAVQLSKNVYHEAAVCYHDSKQYSYSNVSMECPPVAEKLFRFVLNPLLDTFTNSAITASYQHV